MQLALLSNSTREHRASQLVVAGVALVGASLIAVDPIGPAALDIQQRAVQLTTSFDDVLADYESVFSSAGTNLQDLMTGAQSASSELSQQLSSMFGGYGELISNALTGAATGLQNAFYGGWYGGDDGYVFGLFGGDVTSPAGVTESGSTLQEIMTALGQGDLFTAYSYFDEWSLEAMDHTLKSLLSPILSVTSHGVTTPALPGELLQDLTNVVEQFGTWANLKSLGDALMSPEISVSFGFTGILTQIGTDLSSGDFTSAMNDVLKAPADLLGDLLNGYDAGTNPYNGVDAVFTGLLNSGSLLQDLMVTWPQMLATALGASSTDATSAAVASLGGDSMDLASLFDPSTLTDWINALF